jgi:photosynthetic reaction center cytochrome c subunit
VPAQLWVAPVPQDKRADFIGNRNGQNAPATGVGLMALPNDPLTPYLLNASAVRVASPTALPRGNQTSIQATEATYGLMVHISNSLGVNCTYCHNSRSFGNWAESSPKRTVAWHGIRMANDLNKDYLVPLGKTLPAARLGPTGDAPKVSCATCHQGAYKPLYGAAMAKDYPGLMKPVALKVGAALPPPAAEGRVVLAQPQQAGANGAGEDPSARRVEVTLK